MKFDFAIGNPAYQETQDATSDKPVYNFFMDEAYKIADKVEMITPARFLFNAGKTPKTWNNKMLSDEHFKVMTYEPDARKVFPGAEIKGGVVITYRSNQDTYCPIDIYTSFAELNQILTKIRSTCDSFISSIIFSPESYRFTETLYSDHPELRSMTMINKEGKEVPVISKGHDYDLTSNIFDKLPSSIFSTTPPSTVGYIKVLGRKDNSRCILHIKANYIADHPNLNKYKLAFPKVNGNGSFGEILTPPEVIAPGVAHTQTFLSMGEYGTVDEVNNLAKYLRTKFARAMLGVLKVTQDNKKSVWKYVPLQDFTPNSDIDWSVSIHDIDKQFYKKYGLTQEEIDFIETHVKEME